MKEIIALEKMIEDEEKRIAFARHQLGEHESGTNKLTAMIKASTETKLEESLVSLELHHSMLDKLLAQDIEKLEEDERLKEAIKRKNYFKYQKVRLKRDIVSSNDEKLEAMMIIDELPSEVQFEDKELFDLAQKTIELNLRVHEGLDKELNEITKKFNELLKNCKDSDISEITLLNTQIPILILHFSVLLSNILENIEERNLAEFHGFPKYEDWWITELWSSHQAYFGLYKWKDIVSNLCISSDQKRAWEVIFANWIFVKKMLNGKGKLAYEYNFAFDTLLKDFAKLEEELSNPNILAMESIVEKITAKEDFSTVNDTHNIITPYLIFKRKRLDYKDDNNGK